MKRKGYLFLAAALITAASFIVVQQSNRSIAIASVVKWCRLEAFPKSATDITIKTEGGMFTRSFRFSFLARPEDIKAWIAKSPGLNDAKIEKDQKVTKYIISPGGGAAYAQVLIEDNKVSIYSYWS